MIEERAIHHKLLSKCKKGHVNGPYTKKTYEPQGFVENCNSKYQNKSVFIYKKISVLSISFNENMCNLIVKKILNIKKHKIFAEVFNQI